MWEIIKSSHIFSAPLILCDYALDTLCRAGSLLYFVANHTDVCCFMACSIHITHSNNICIIITVCMTVLAETLLFVLCYLCSALTCRLLQRILIRLCQPQTPNSETNNSHCLLPCYNESILINQAESNIYIHLWCVFWVLFLRPAFTGYWGRGMCWVKP